jgi:hypothetical protein
MHCGRPAKTFVGESLTDSAVRPARYYISARLLRVCCTRDPYADVCGMSGEEGDRGEGKER